MSSAHGFPRKHVATTELLVMSNVFWLCFITSIYGSQIYHFHLFLDLLGDHIATPKKDRKGKLHSNSEECLLLSSFHACQVGQVQITAKTHFLYSLLISMVEAQQPCASASCSQSFRMFCQSYSRHCVSLCFRDCG